VSLGALIALSLALGLAAWLFFMWTVRSGQYEDPEGPKYRMLEDDEGESPRSPAPPPTAARAEQSDRGAPGSARDAQGERGRE
jgi:cbb3-type cytochrome oxidase maturation protein